MTIRLHVLWVPGADPLRDGIVEHLRAQEDTEVCTHEDPERRGLMQNWLSALACAAATDTGPWSFIVQDDAMPCRGWQSHLRSACHYSPQPVLGLTHSGSYGTKILARGAAYGVGRDTIWGCAVAYRHDFLVGLAEWAPRVVAETGYPHDDRLVAAYAKRVGVRTAMVARAIFDEPPQTRSLMGHGYAQGVRPATIESTPGPRYGAFPRSVPVSASVSPEINDLARRG